MIKSHKLLEIYKNRTLPISIATGILIFIAFHFLKLLNPLKVITESFVSHFVPLLVFSMQFFTFCKIDPKQMKIKKWHLMLVAL